MIRRLPRVSRDKRETKDNLIHCFRAKVAITFQNTKSYKVKQKLHVHPYEDIKKRKAMIRRLPRVSRDKHETEDNLIHCFRAKVAITFQKQ